MHKTLTKGKIDMAKRSDETKRTDVEELRDKIKALLLEYNCALETEDYSGLWLRDKDTGETAGMRGA